MKKLKNDNLKPLNENDIRPKNLMKDQKKAMNADVEWLKNRSKDFINVTCPSCGSNNSKPLYKKYHLIFRVFRLYKSLRVKHGSWILQIKLNLV